MTTSFHLHPPQGSDPTAVSDRADIQSPQSDPTVVIEGAALQLSVAKKRISLPQKLLALSREELKDHIKQTANRIYGDEAKDG
ncbi:hypothetical protein PCASD_12806 [Puccinia coronata f. sp. avenae]|uniref:Uncharacterized protein n=1 Tax=Puccinia coronata f. sp. avenae TaxID=200324 RepID=A0A2N5UW82_9BASI|nr:hypothetical protein PCASD_12806 [Puccinia coronata f. sp. avenae]